MLVTETNLPLRSFSKGKVRDMYELGDKFLMVATDRVSAFDVVLPNPVADKGKVLNQLSAFWFNKTKSIIPNHVVKVIEKLSDLKDLNFPTAKITDFSYLVGRSMVVKKAKRIPAECVVRGYISGSAWAEYRQKGTINGAPAPKGLQESQKLEVPLFTPTTKAEAGHDLPLAADGLASLVGKEVATELERKSIDIYNFARQYALSRGIIIADTKLEFGMLDGNMIVIDEMLTPDSSRFWPVKGYTVGRSQQSFDKQPLRDWLEGSGWNKEPPAPQLPVEVVKQTSEKYREAYRLLTGKLIK